jgi:hypothetical protein
VKESFPAYAGHNVIGAAAKFARGKLGHPNYRSHRQRLCIRVEDAFRAVTEKTGRRPVGRNDAQRQILDIDPSLKAEDQYDVGTIIFSIFNAGL